jgi:hypothetical protein
MNSRTWMIGLWVSLGLADGSLGANLSNGGFDNGLTGWQSAGNVTAGTSPGTGNGFVVLSEPGAGGRSRLYQDFNLPASPQYLYFRYGLSSAPRAAGMTAPPDGFTAYLLSDTGDRLVILSADPPTFSKGFFYADGDAEKVYASAYVTVAAQPDADGLIAVQLNISSLTGSPQVRLEFGLAAADNGVPSYVVLDGAYTACPPGYCCAANGTFTPLTDSDPCTIDTCDANGVPQHVPEPSGCCGECNSTRANVVIMLDLTGSILTPALVAEVAGAKALLEVFSNGDPRPLVAIGTFNGPCAAGNGQGCAEIVDGARIKAGLTDSYANLNLALDQILIDEQLGNRPANGLTNLKAAIDVAQSILPVPETANSPNYIVVVSDGIPNRPRCTDPPNGPPCCPQDQNQYCICSVSDNAAANAADSAEAAGTDIFAIHYEGDHSCSGEPAAGIQFMRDSIATSSAFFIDGDTADIAGDYDLICAFHGVVQSISCDDGDPASRDCCRNAECAHGAACESP